VDQSLLIRCLTGKFQSVGRWALYALCAICCLMTMEARGADDGRPKRVLMISTGSRFSPGFPVAEQGALDTLRQARPGQIEFYAEHLDIIRFPSESYHRLFRDYLYEKYAQYPPDLLILFYVGNLVASQKLLGQIFPGVPIVVAGLTEEEVPVGRLSSHLSGLAQRIDARGTIDLILRLQPETRRIIVIGGTAEVDRSALNRVQEATRWFIGRVEFDFWSDRPLAKIRDTIKTLPPQTTILFARMYRDSAGQAIIPAQAAQLIAESANAPVYILADSMLGTGAVGGSVANVAALGQRAGEQAHRILSGVAPAQSSLEIRTDGVPTFDWRALKRWGISENRVPLGSSVRFRPQSVWEQYKWLIIIVLVVCLLEAALIDILLRERRRRRLAQQRLEERLRFEQLVSELSSTFINLAPEKVEAQIIEALGQVASLLRFDIAALSVFTGRGTESRVAYIWRAEGVPEIPSDLTDKDFPWSAQELFAGRDVCLRSLEMLPLAARTDRATYEKYHVRSSYSVPMVAGGKVIGVLALNMVRNDHEISPELLQGQRLLGEIFANALARRAADGSRRESEQNLRALVETTAAVPWQADTESWVFTYVGPQAVRLLGYPLDQWYEKDFWVSHLHPDDKEFAVNTCLTLSKSTEDFEFEYRMIDSSGETVWVHDIVKCEHRDGKPIELRGFMLDISERKQAEEALHESEERISLAANTAGLGLWVWDATRDETWTTPEGRALFGWAESEPVTLERFVQTLHPDDREPTRQAVLRSLQSGSDYIAEYRVVLSGGAIRWIATRGRIELDGNGSPLRLRGVSIDITERKSADEALRESEARFHTMADTAPVMIWMAGADKLCTFLNKGWLDFTGRMLEQELGNGWAEGVHPRDFDRCLGTYVNSFDARQEFTMEYRLRRYDGEYCWVLDHGVPRFAPDGKFVGYIGTAIDITESKRAEEALEKEREFLRQVIDIDPNFIFAKDRAGRFTLVNQAVADAYGTTVEDLIGKTDADFNANHEEVEFFHRMDLEVMDTLKERFIPEEHLTDAQGNVRWLQTVKRPIINKDGSANQILGASTDITQRKQAELELQHNRQELAHVTRISTMGELAASLAHELNQPLTAILSNAQAAQRFMAAKPADLEEVREILKDIVQDDSRASEVIQRMRALVKKEEVAFVPLDLEEVIRDVARLVHNDAGLLNVDVALELNFGLPLVRGDRVQLQQVVLNLMLNAFDAMKDCPVNERRVVLRAEQDGARMAKVTVHDRGPGVRGDKLETIFQPFYTTKRDGLGMGLSISRSIIHDHGGGLWAENNPDRGATFCFTVPVGDGEG
jgi:two-component system, LuxR family, sensor kinase FixL